jgi:hypothetical protein
MTWFNNDEGFEAQRPKKNYVNRFWMPKDSEKTITFVDDTTVMCGDTKITSPLFIEEYQLNLNGHWRNWFTRPFKPEDDLLKEMGYRASRVAVFTIIDHSEWTDKKGTQHKDELKLFVVKRSAPIYKQIEKLMSRHGSLRGRVFNVSRMGDKSPAVGSMLEYLDHSEPEEVPFNYLEVLKPKTRVELEAVFNPATDNSSWGGGNTPKETSSWSDKGEDSSSQSSWSNNGSSPSQGDSYFNSKNQNSNDGKIPF